MAQHVIQSIIIYLSTWGLCEPQRPLVLKGVLNVEVILVVEDGDGLASVGLANLLLSVGVDRDG